MRASSRRISACSGDSCGSRDWSCGVSSACSRAGGLGCGTAFHAAASTSSRRSVDRSKRAMYIRAVGASSPPPAHSTARSTPATDRPSSISRSWYRAAMMPASALSRNPYAVAAA